MGQQIIVGSARFDVLIVLAAAVLDYVVGDPRILLHPVQVIGRVVTWGSKTTLKLFPGPRGRKGAGILLGISVIGGSGLLAWGVVQWSARLSPSLAIAIQIIGTASCFAGTSLAQAAQRVLAPLQQGNLPQSRLALGQFVGRDTAQLSSEEILRATVESVAENTIDGVTAPLYYALVGVVLPTIGPWPMAIAYKAASTLDSMIGYRREPYTDLGWFSAQLEDRLTWLPCRLTVLILALLSGTPRAALQICQRDAPQDPSPNSGWSEAIYAAILGVQLGGENVYQGIVRYKPLLGDRRYPMTYETVREALAYSRWVFFLLLSGGSLCLWSWLA